MSDDDEQLAALRQKLAEAERAREDAVADAASIRQRWSNERVEEQHRLRNLFAVIRAIVHRTGDDAVTVDDYCGVLDGRLSAYLRTQTSILQDWNEGVDLGLLLGEVLLSFALKEGERVDLVGPPIRLTSQAAGIAALTFHEFAFNSVLNDRIGTPGCHVTVKWHLTREEDEPSLSIEWTDRLSDTEHHEALPSSWADWIEQAVRYQLAGCLTTQLVGASRTHRLCLPSTILCQD